jgi:hypothetical protein
MKKSYDEKGKELELPEGRGGGKGAKNGPGVPPRTFEYYNPYQ